MKTKLLLFSVLAGAGAVFNPTPAAAQQILPGHVPKAVTRLNLQPVGPLPATNRLHLVIGLPFRKKDVLTNLLQQIYNPASTNYHHYLTPNQFTEMFGPTEQDYQAVIAFAKAQGLAVKGTHPSHTLLDVDASVAAIEKAFHVKLRVYQHPLENRRFFAPDTEPSIDLNVLVLHITGLDSYIVPYPNLRATPINKATKPNAGSGSGGNYQGYDFRDAYTPGVSLNGSGQVVGLLELDGYNFSDIQAYVTLTGISTTTLVQRIELDGFSGSAGTNNSEVCLDIEMAISMAPGLKQVTVYEVPNNGVDWMGILDEMANPTQGEPLPLQLSSSWTLADNSSAEQYYNEFATQGQTFFQSSGDDGAYYPEIAESADSVNVTIVGGTELTTSSGGFWASETTWNNGYDSTVGHYWASGGGISQNYSIPSWQQGISMAANQGSATMRNIPDVAMVADNIWVTYSNGLSGSFQGTSASTPLWAGFMALVNQQAVASGLSARGFINPAIYSIGESASYSSAFHDIADYSDNGNNHQEYFAVSGYDLCTGWGTPNGLNLINDLAPLPDLTRESDNLNNLNPQPGDTVTASITIQNQSCSILSSAAGAFHVGFYWSTNSSFSGVSPFVEAAVSGCLANGTVSLSQNILINTGTLPGTFYLGYKINDENEVAECDQGNNGFFYWTVTVSNSVASCTYLLSPTNASLGPGSSSGSFSVTAGTGCSWTATANQTWIHTSNSGSGNGTVNYSVDANTSTNSQTGTISVQGQTFTITQAGMGTGSFGALTVTLLPTRAVSAGAHWQVDGGPNQTSGVKVTNLSAGNHTVSFTPVSGWDTPAAQTVTIIVGAATNATGVYTPLTTGTFQTLVLDKLSITATLLEQGATSTAANGSGKISAPVKLAWTTATMLHQLLVDEVANGTLQSTSVPAATLNYNAASGDFEINNATNGLLADVSSDGIFTLSTNGASSIEDGTFGTNGLGGGPPFNQTNFYLGTLTYASPSANTTTPQSWKVTGLVAITSKATNPKANGNYTQSSAITYSAGTGGGTITPINGPNNGASTPVIFSGFTITSPTGSAAENNGSGP